MGVQRLLSRPSHLIIISGMFEVSLYELKSVVTRTSSFATNTCSADLEVLLQRASESAYRAVLAFCVATEDINLALPDFDRRLSLAFSNFEVQHANKTHFAYFSGSLTNYPGVFHNEEPIDVLSKLHVGWLKDEAKKEFKRYLRQEGGYLVPSVIASILTYATPLPRPPPPPVRVSPPVCAAPAEPVHVSPACAPPAEPELAMPATDESDDWQVKLPLLGEDVKCEVKDEGVKQDVVSEEDVKLDVKPPPKVFKTHLHSNPWTRGAEVEAEVEVIDLSDDDDDAAEQPPAKRRRGYDGYDAADKLRDHPSKLTGFDAGSK